MIVQYLEAILELCVDSFHVNLLEHNIRVSFFLNLSYFFLEQVLNLEILLYCLI